MSFKVVVLCAILQLPLLSHASLDLFSGSSVRLETTTCKSIRNPKQSSYIEMTAYAPGTGQRIVAVNGFDGNLRKTNYASSVEVPSYVMQNQYYIKEGRAYVASWTLLSKSRKPAKDLLVSCRSTAANGALADGVNTLVRCSAYIAKTDQIQRRYFKIKNICYSFEGQGCDLDRLNSEEMKFVAHEAYVDRMAVSFDLGEEFTCEETKDQELSFFERLGFNSKIESLPESRSSRGTGGDQVTISRVPYNKKEVDDFQMATREELEQEYQQRLVEREKDMDQKKKP